MQEFLENYTKPFVYDRFGGYIKDSNGEIVLMLRGFAYLTKEKNKSWEEIEVMHHDFADELLLPLINNIQD